MKLIDMSERRPDRWLADWARKSPDAVFLIFVAEGSRMSFAEAHRSGLHHAAYLESTVGLSAGEHLGLMLPNGAGWAKVWLGSLVAGIVEVGIHPELSGPILAHHLRAARVKAVFCEPAAARSVVAVAAVEQGLPLKTIVVAGAPDRDLTHAAERLGLAVLSLADAAHDAPATPAAPRAERDSRDVAAIRFTSGTTGPAKAATLTMSQIAVWSDYMVQMMQFEPRDRIYAPYPLHHHLSSIMGVVAALRAGGCCIVDRQFSASRFWARAIEHEATLGLILDPVINILLKAPPSPQDRGHRIRQFYIARPNPEFEERFGARLRNAYALTEANVLSYGDASDGIASPHYVGRINPHFDVRVFDEFDEEVPPGQPGEIVFRPRHPFTSMTSYHEDGAATVAAIRNLWFHTRDLGSVDAEGHLYFVERMGDTIRRRGVNIPSFHIEQTALAFPGIADAAAVGVPAAVGEFDVKLCILEQSPGAVSPEALTRWLRTRLPREMVPRYLEIRETFSRTITNKIIKRPLKEEGVSERTVVTDPWLND